jgi:Flp pilus assembly pilin Flp
MTMFRLSGFRLPGFRLSGFRLPGAEGTRYLRALLAGRAVRLRQALRSSDRGASAIELAIITAVLVGLAVVILTIIYNFATSQANTITTHTIPGGGNGNGG